jgi:predicted RNA-binding protein with RPS1 domain
MTKKWHTILSNRLKEEKKQHGERKKRLEAQTKEEYEHAVTQLTQWDKELLFNTQHQLSSIAYI